MNVNSPTPYDLRPAGRSRITRRNLLSTLAVVPAIAVLLAACGDPSSAGSDDTNPGTAAPPTTSADTAVPTTDVPTTDVPIPTDFSYSPDPDDFVIRIAYEGGFVPMEVSFVNQPTLLVSGDGRAFTPAASTLEYPGPLVDSMYVQTITPAGIQSLLRLAHDAGLLGDIPDYSSEAQHMIADAADTVVEIRANGTTYVHRAYALGMDPDAGNAETTPSREALLEFVMAAQDLESAAGPGEVGEPLSFNPSHYRLRATEYASDVADPVGPRVAWPNTAGITLAEATECAVIPVEALSALVAPQEDVLFIEGDKLYTIAITGVLPGDEGCQPAS